jgi:general secretion pathway protein D
MEFNQAGRNMKRTLLVVITALCFVGQSFAEQTWTVNFKETDIQELIRFVANATKKTVIIDPKVKGKVQVISARPVNEKELYDLFLSILEVQGYTAVESGDVVRIIPIKNARSTPVRVVDDVTGNNSEVITQVIQLENVSAAKLIPVLRPLAPQQAHMAAYAPSNAIIISDTAANIQRIKKIINKIDLSAVEKTEIINLEHASADEVVRMLERLQKSEATKGQAQTKKILLVADKRTNSVLINGDELERQRVTTLIHYLDTPLAQSGNVRVIYLEYANAKDLAGVLQKVIQNIEDMTSGDKTKAARSSKATIEADEGTNALIVTASADVMQSLLSVVERLDIRRAQVLVEAIIVEVSADNRQALGVEWLFVDNDGAYGSVNATPQSVAPLGDGSGGSDPIVDVAKAISTGVQSAILGVGRLDDDLSFSVLIQALQKNREANILSTPTLLTLDNEEATFVVGQNVPFVTGSYTSTGNSSNPDSPFQTVERENVGITLKVTPQINEGDFLVLELSQEVSNVIPDAIGVGGNPITSERKIDTKVLAKNGQTIVLGGLIQDDVVDAVSKVPFLGDIPWLGRLFRSNGTTITKKHLMIFLRSTIIRDDETLNAATAEKYNMVRKGQIKRIEDAEAFTMGVELPLLPEWEEQLKKLEVMKNNSESAANESAVQQ